MRQNSSAFTIVLPEVDIVLHLDNTILCMPYRTMPHVTIKNATPLLLLLVFGLCEFCVNPIGNFPLNDDWWYARLYYSLSGIRQNDPIQWPSAAFVGQYLWARTTALFFGHTLSALRASSILAAMLILWLFHKTTRLSSVSPWLALALTLCLLANPIFFSLSNSFMSDITFLLYAMGATLGLFVFVETHSTKSLIASCLLYTLAILTRQVAAVLVVAAIVAAGVSSKRIAPAALLLLPLIALFVFEVVLSRSGKGISYAYIFLENPGNHADAAPGNLVYNYTTRWVHFTSFTAFSLFPLLLPYLVRQVKIALQNKTVKLPAVALLLSLPVWYSLKNFPIGNYLYNLGLGPETLYDTYLGGLSTGNLQSNTLFFLMKGITVLCVPSLLHAILRCTWRLFSGLQNKQHGPGLFRNLYLFLSIAGYYFLMCHRDAIFDRYMLPFLVFTLLFLCNEITPQRLSPAPLLLVALLTAFSVFATRDYLNCQRTRWQAIDFLTHTYAVPSASINAGYEHAGYLLGQTPQWYTHWQNSPPRPYLLAHGPVPGYNTFTWFSYYRTLSFTTDTIYILKRNAPNLN